MKNQNLSRLSRKDLIQLLLEQSRQISALQAKLEATEKLLQEKKLNIETTGSIAEASLQLNGVFEASQKACDQYQENVRLQCEQMLKNTREECRNLRREYGVGEVPDQEASDSPEDPVWMDLSDIQKLLEQ